MALVLLAESGRVPRSVPATVVNCHSNTVTSVETAIDTLPTRNERPSVGTSKGEEFSFLHILTARVKRTRATAFYLVDPTVHDPQTVTSLTSLFNTVLEVD